MKLFLLAAAFLVLKILWKAEGKPKNASIIFYVFLIFWLILAATILAFIYFLKILWETWRSLLKLLWLFCILIDCKKALEVLEPIIALELGCIN